MTMHIRVARREEQEAVSVFGENYTVYAAKTPTFFPHLSIIDAFGGVTAIGSVGRLYRRSMER